MEHSISSNTDLSTLNICRLCGAPKIHTFPYVFGQLLMLLDAWDQINGRSLTRTKEQVAAAEELARIKATSDDLRNVQTRLLRQKDGFWKARGVSLKNIANNFHLATLSPVRSSDDRKASIAAPSVQSATTPVDTGKPRKLLRRAPSATQVELLPIDKQEVRTAL